MRFLCLNYTVLSAVSQVRFAILPIFHNQSAIYSYCQQAQNRKNKENRGFEIKKLLQPVRNERLQQLFSFFLQTAGNQDRFPVQLEAVPCGKEQNHPQRRRDRHPVGGILNSKSYPSPCTSNRVCFYHTTIGAVLQWETRFFPFFALRLSAFSRMRAYRQSTVAGRCLRLHPFLTISRFVIKAYG